MTDPKTCFASYRLQTTLEDLENWARTPCAETQEETCAAIRSIGAREPEDLLRVRGALARIVTSLPTREAFDAEPSAALCLVVVDRALGGEPVQEVDEVVDCVLREHGGDLVRASDHAFGSFRDLSRTLECLLDVIPLTENEDWFCRQALAFARFEDADRFVNASVDAADYLGEDLKAFDEDQLADSALLAWLLQSFAAAQPTFSGEERARLVRGLSAPCPTANPKETDWYLRLVLVGDAVASLDCAVARTDHLGLLRAFVEEAPASRAPLACAALRGLEEPRYPMAIPTALSLAPCTHCRRRDRDEHCSATTSGEHQPYVEGAIHSYDPHAECCDVEIRCSACGARGHVCPRVVVDLDQTTWDDKGSA
jgi:hypothetical protein